VHQKVFIYIIANHPSTMDDKFGRKVIKNQNCVVYYL